jgi:transcriptional regulator with XRE-family HTH domain
VLVGGCESTGKSAFQSRSAATAGETARRVRAARAYAGLSVQHVATKIGVGAKTVKRIESGERLPRQYELWAIAETCGVPRDFFEASLPAPYYLGVATNVSLEERLTRIEAALSALLARVPDAAPD